MPHAEALRHFLHRHQELIAACDPKTETKKPAMLSRAFSFVAARARNHFSRFGL
jgi:hypothetical protein